MRAIEEEKRKHVTAHGAVMAYRNLVARASDRIDPRREAAASAERIIAASDEAVRKFKSTLGA